MAALGVAFRDLSGKVEDPHDETVFSSAIIEKNLQGSGIQAACVGD